MHQYKPILVYTARFLGLFAVLFYGTEAIIGLSSPGNHYLPFVENYLDFITPFRHFLLGAAGDVLSLFGYQTFMPEPQVLAFRNGASVLMGYDCIGYGVLSFWIAFIFANRGTGQKKTAWMVGGCLALIAINILRILLVLLAAQKGWPMPLGWDHHTWFNIVAYLLIFGMIWGYDRRANVEQRAMIFEP
ncbi:MAG: exosortase/archaeosortase family protein [Chitinophagaceae bacterium]|nr:MAG: exosortase/archaeosortase family protein [Chitinophagaceae bacterium]